MPLTSEKLDRAILDYLTGRGFTPCDYVASNLRARGLPAGSHWISGRLRSLVHRGLVTRKPEAEYIDGRWIPHYRIVR